MQSLKSSLDVMECADLFQWLQNARKTGLCRFSRDSAIRRVYFENGRIVACSSNEPHLLLGQFLIANGRIDEVDLQRCMKLQESCGEALGKLLIDAKKISEEELKRIVTAKAEETIFGLFEWFTGTFCFEPDRHPPDDAMRVDLNVQSVVLEGTRRLDELKRTRTVLGSMGVVLHKTDRAPDPSAVASYMGDKLYESIDGRRTLAEIILFCRSSEYLACRFLAHLVETGQVRTGETRAPEIDAVQDARTIRRLRDLVTNGEYEEAVELIDEYGVASAEGEFLGMLIARAEAGFLAMAYRTKIPPDAVPRRVETHDPSLHAEALTSEESLLLDMVEGNWDVRSLSWIAPMRKVDIVRGLLRLQEYGHIELQSPRTAIEPLADPDHDATTEGNGERVGELAVDRAFGAAEA